ncbi:carboxylesterase [Cupriavidus necator]|nr:carboxylesterase [Cupriavidus necator]
MAQTAPAEPRAAGVTVTVDNFKRAESDMYFSTVAKQGGFGKLRHQRDLMPIDRQSVVRANRDTAYSTGIFDLDAGPVTITLPDAGKRFRSVIAINEDHYVTKVAYGKGPYTFTREQIGTRYVMIGVRTLVDARDPADLQVLYTLQDGITLQQTAPGSFEVPEWGYTSQKRVRDALATLGDTLPNLNDAFGMPGKVSPIHHLIGTAIAWGGNPREDAMYLNVKPPRNDGVTVYRLRVADVPVDGFWSISVYNEKGYFEPNAQGAYTLNNLVAKKDADGAVSVQFGGCDGKQANCLPVTPGWNYMVRLYQPRAQILDGRWKFPEAVAVQ